MPYTVQNDTINGNVWYTKNAARGEVYAIVLGWPGRTLRLGAMSVFDFSGAIGLLGNPGLTLDFSVQAPGILVEMPMLEDVRSKWAYTFVFKT